MKDDMWDFLKHREANPIMLENAVKSLTHMAMQKTAGQRVDKPNDIPYQALDLIKWTIICEACSLVLDDRWNKAKELFNEKHSSLD